MSTEAAKSETTTKEVSIFVNTVPVPVPKGSISYDKVVAIAYPNLNINDYTFKVTYVRREDQKHPESLAKGQTTEVTADMRFTVVNAGRS